MLKKLIAMGAATLALTGCVAVPVYDSEPAYGYYYGPPAASFSFGYTYHDSPRHYNRGDRHRHGDRHRSGPRHRHGR